MLFRVGAHRPGGGRHVRRAAVLQGGSELRYLELWIRSFLELGKPRPLNPMQDLITSGTSGAGGTR